MTTKSGDLNREERIIFKKNKRIFKNWTFYIYGDDDNLRIIREHYLEFLKKYEKISRGVMKAVLLDVFICISMEGYI
jgi:hypothetical protein